MKITSEFTFNDFCQPCGKVTEHKVATDDSNVFGVCTSCNLHRTLTDLKQVYYPKTDLWITRFKVGNLDNIVSGKLIDFVRNIAK